MGSRKFLAWLFAAMLNLWLNGNDVNHLWLFGAMSLRWFNWNDVNYWWFLIVFHVMREQRGESLVIKEWSVNYISIKGAKWNSKYQFYSSSHWCIYQFDLFQLTQFCLGIKKTSSKDIYCNVQMMIQYGWSEPLMISDRFI